MSFPPATEMFQFAGFASSTYGFSRGYPCGWVAPFGDPGINDRSHLPRAYRSVPRPSSPLSAKASTRCPSYARSPAPACWRRTSTRHAQGQKPRPATGRQNDFLVHDASREDTLPQRQVNIPYELSAISCQPSANETPASVTLSSPCQRTHRQCRRIAGETLLPPIAALALASARRRQRHPWDAAQAARCRTRHRATAPVLDRSLSWREARATVAATLTHHKPAAYGGGERDRTDDLLLAKQALSQLSYTPALTTLARGGASDGPNERGPVTKAAPRRIRHLAMPRSRPEPRSAPGRSRGILTDTTDAATSFGAAETGGPGRI